MSQLILLVGPPGSGKTTLATTEFQGYHRVSQDDQGKEGHKEIFNKLLTEGHNIIVDRINHTQEQRSRYLLPAKEAGYQTKIVVLHQPFSECLERCSNRTDHPSIKSRETASKALHGFFKAYERVTDHEADVVDRRYHSDEYKRKIPCVVFDIDNTMADNKHREHYMQEGKKDWKGFFSQMHNDKVVPAVQFLYQMVETFNMSLKENCSDDWNDYLVPIFCSARPDDYRKVTKEWLCENGVGWYDRLIMRGRNDYRRDDLVKEQMLDFEILPRYKVEFWCDDRDQVVSKIRSRGIPVFQVAPGEF